jgi:hypothetical protein
VSQAEIMRLGIYILNAVNVSAIVAVMVLHFQAWRKTPKSENRLMPLHVVAISAAHILYIILATSAALRYYQENPFNWRTLLFVIASLITLFALFHVGEFQRRRLMRANSDR